MFNVRRLLVMIFFVLLVISIFLLLKFFASTSKYQEFTENIPFLNRQSQAKQVATLNGIDIFVLSSYPEYSLTFNKNLEQADMERFLAELTDQNVFSFPGDISQGHASRKISFNKPSKIIFELVDQEQFWYKTSFGNETPFRSTLTSYDTAANELTIKINISKSMLEGENGLETSSWHFNIAAIQAIYAMKHEWESASGEEYEEAYRRLNDTYQVMQGKPTREFIMFYIDKT